MEDVKGCLLNYRLYPKVGAKNTMLEIPLQDKKIYPEMCYVKSKNDF